MSEPGQDTRNPGEPFRARIRMHREELDRHFLEMVRWHFDPKTGTPYWIDWAQSTGFDPLESVQSFDDIHVFPHFNDEILRTRDHEALIPRAFLDRPFHVFETGGTTGVPKQRLSWDDHEKDYEEFSRTLSDESFPPSSAWLMIGPTGPRRLRLCIEHLANFRGGICYHVDLDPRWVKKLIQAGDSLGVRAYKTHVIDQALAILRTRNVRCLFTTPLLLEALGEKISISRSGIRGVFCGGTTMTPQTVRFLVEEVLENQVAFVPTYGNTLMGLAASRPVRPENGYSVTYHAPQPRAVLRVIDPENPDHLVPYETFGRVELTTLTREFFMPRFLERDEALRREPCEDHPFDGVGDVRPFGSTTQSIVEGVY